jgi:hypothetical protein
MSQKSFSYPAQCQGQLGKIVSLPNTDKKCSVEQFLLPSLANKAVWGRVRDLNYSLIGIKLFLSCCLEFNLCSSICLYLFLFALILTWWPRQDTKSHWYQTLSFLLSWVQSLFQYLPLFVPNPHMVTTAWHKVSYQSLSFLLSWVQSLFQWLPLFVPITWSDCPILTVDSKMPPFDSTCETNLCSGICLCLFLLHSQTALSLQ